MSRAAHRLHTLSVLAQLRAIGAVPRKRRIGRIPRPTQPTQIENQYARTLIEAVCKPARAWFEREALAEVMAALVDLRRMQGRADAADDRRKVGAALSAAERRGKEAREQHAAESWKWSEEAGHATEQGKRAAMAVDRAARGFADAFDPHALKDVVHQFGKRTDYHARLQLDKQLRSAIGVNLSTIEKPMADQLGEWTADQVGLIVTVPGRYFDGLQDDVQDAFAGGTHPSTFADELEDRYDMSEGNAERIARDQVLSLAASLNHARMESLGVERAVWRTMRDNRVCDECFEKEGQEFVLSDGLDGIVPGDCHPVDRCYSEPLLDDLIDG